MVIVKLQGGMGNQMFQYALGRALSVRNNTELGLDLSYLLDKTKRPGFHKFTFRDYDLDVFNIKAEILPHNKIPFFHRRYLKGIISIYYEGLLNKINQIINPLRYYSFDSSILENKSKNIYLNGNWQSYKYFEKISDIIKKDFTFKNKFSNKIVDLIEVIKKEDSLCVHVRRGDYVGNKHHEVVNKEYYDRGIEYIEKHAKIDKIYVFSDDTRWCEENMEFSYPTMFVGNEYAGERAEGHLNLMIHCKNFIIANSTFSWWGAWLSQRENKIVIAPKKWFNDKIIKTDDLIPKEWIKIRNDINNPSNI